MAETSLNAVCFYCMRSIKPGQGYVCAILLRWTDYDEREECFHTDFCFHLFQIAGRPHNPVYAVKAVTGGSQSS